MNLKSFNSLEFQKAAQILRQCCSSETWISRVLENRPFSQIEDIELIANTSWKGLSEKDYLQAFEGHPKIGEINSLKQKYKESSTLSKSEQSGISSANELILAELAEKNISYEKKFGFIFIVCATGKNASQILSLLDKRMTNSRAKELSNACEEQRKIMQLRIRKLL